MKKTIYDYIGYRKYLRELFESMPGSGRGARAELAKALGCQRSFVSQVLQEEMHFSLEQAEKINRHIGHSAEEADFFILLVQFNRAGTKQLSEYFRGKIKQTLNDRLTYDKRLQSESVMSFEDQVHYYSAWHYSAWHYSAICVALGVPELRTPSALAVKLSLPIKTIQEALEFLTRCGLIEKQGAQFVRRTHHQHLGENSALLPRFHTNWRVKTISALQQEGAKDLHFSCAMTLSKEDTYKLQALLVRYIEDFKKEVVHSPDETVAALCIDFFEL